MIKRNKNLSIKPIDCMTFIVTMFFVAYYFLRLFGFFVDSITFVIPLIIAAVYMVLTMNWAKTASKYIIGIIGLVVGITFVELLCTDNFEFVAFISRFTYLFMNMFPLYLVYSILKSKNRKLQIVILTVFAIILVYVCILTFIELKKDDRFMREMEINYTNYRKYNLTNAGGYQFAYAMAILTGLLSPMFLLNYRRYNKLKKVGLILALIASVLLVLNSSYTLALMISVVVILLAVTYKMKSTTKIVFGLISIILILLLLYASDFIIELVPTKEMKLRLSEVFAFFKSGDTSGYNLSGRLTLYGRAIMAFLKSPLIGNVSLDFDPHSSILRFFARDGILGGVGYLLLYYLGYQIVVKYFIGKEKENLFKPVFVALMLMGLVNPIHSVGAVHYVVFFIAPLALNLVEVNKEKENETPMGN